VTIDFCTHSARIIADRYKVIKRVHDGVSSEMIAAAAARQVHSESSAPRPPGRPHRMIAGQS